MARPIGWYAPSLYLPAAKGKAFPIDDFDSVENFNNDIISFSLWLYLPKVKSSLATSTSDLALIDIVVYG